MADKALGLMYSMASRAQVLADRPLLELRLAVATADTVGGAKAETRHRSRGDLMEEILIEEFEHRAADIEEE